MAERPSYGWRDYVLVSPILIGGVAWLAALYRDPVGALLFAAVFVFVGLWIWCLAATMGGE